ncbi:hypothetical protein BSZ39_00405 [Bowdeniella nasicola]|uniref:PAC2 family protein n=1 Tax=Bowdeniella nasicola TaxID=208480 RepID=A0A1Q5Q5U1_9ACTO|nr:PAC2 family protein [Bowdeniella nasicola]OKL55198.1 hypothetical protein BSZ39_00405 [Bowdeniella nasicola]
MSEHGRRAKSDYPRNDGAVIRHREVPHAPIFIHAMGSRSEPGETNYLLAQNLVGSLHTERVFTFDSDQFINYSSQRPIITMERNRFVDYQPVEIAVDLLRDDEGRELALLHGPEPSLGWEAFAEHVVQIVKELGSDLAIGVHAVPMTVPHTRPVQVVKHANRDGLGADDDIVDGSVQWAASMASTLEYKFGQAGIDAIGFGAGIPFYIAQSSYPQAAAELIRRISEVSGLALPLGDLEAASLQVSAAIDTELEGDQRMEQMLAWMEKSYDDRIEDGGQPNHSELTDVPSAEEIGAAAEAFLADFVTQQRAAEEGNRGELPESRRDDEPEDHS